MAIPTFVKKKQLFVVGGTAVPDAVAFASASTAGNLLVLVVNAPRADAAVTTPSGWSLDANLDAGSANGSRTYIYHKTSTGETTFNVTVGDFNHSRTYNMLEYSGLSNAVLEAAAVTNIESPTSDGVGTMPAVPYGAGPRVVLGIIAMAGPGGSDVLGAVGDYTLRTPVVGTDAFKQLATADGLKDDAGGTFASAGVFTNASSGALMCAGLVYMGGRIAEGSLVGRYIGLDAAVTSPFSGVGQELDAIFAINLSETPLPSALLYGPDLVDAIDAGGADATYAWQPLVDSGTGIPILDSGTGNPIMAYAPV